MFIKGEESMKNNNGKIEFNRQFFVDLAKTVVLNASHVRTLSDVQNHEIVVGGKSTLHCGSEGDHSSLWG